MSKAVSEEAGVVLEAFIELMFKLMMDHHQKQVVELELTMPQAHALRMLRRGPLCTGRLAAELQISAPAVTQLTDRLTRKKLIERRAVEGDRRSVEVALTDNGKHAVDKFRERRNHILRGALAHLDGDDVTHVVLALGKMVAALERYEAETAVRPPGASKNSGDPDSQPRKRAETRDGATERIALV